MGALPLALSVHNFISSVGADAGFASIIGLAILILLYFAHARETSALREQAARLAERLQQAEAKLAQSAGTRPAVPAPPLQTARAQGAAPLVQAVPMAGGAAAAVAVAAAAPGAPAGLAAPALASATRFVPVREPATAPATPAAAPARAVPSAIPRPTVPAPPVPQPAAATALAQPAPPAAAPAREPDAERVPVGAPATAAGAANGAGRTAPAGVSTATARRPPPGLGVTGDGPAPGSRRPLPPLATSGQRTSSGPRRVAVAALAVLVVGGAVAGLIIATSSSGTKSITTLTPTSNAPAAKHPARAPSFNPAAVTVAVLNGTATNELAHHISARLAALGYKQGAIATATDQTRTATVVAYMPGSRADAVHVASALRLGSASVQPVDQTTQQVACAGATACTANVVVTVGADLATS